LAMKKRKKVHNVHGEKLVLGGKGVRKETNREKNNTKRNRCWKEGYGKENCGKISWAKVIERRWTDDKGKKKKNRGEGSSEPIRGAALDMQAKYCRPDKKDSL